jgi:hypothetical protein
MRVSVRREGEHWTIKSLMGRFRGQDIAKVDGIALIDARFSFRGNISGFPSAVWGALIEDFVTEDRLTLIGLGINKPFDMRPNRLAVFNGQGFIDGRNKHPVTDASLALTFFNDVFYWRR